MKHPMLLGFIAVVFIAHFLGVIGTVLLPFGFGIVMWKFNRQGWTLQECLACVGFVVFTLMIGLGAFLIFVPIILWMDRMTSSQA